VLSNVRAFFGSLAAAVVAMFGLIVLKQRGDIWKSKAQAAKRDRLEAQKARELSEAIIKAANDARAQSSKELGDELKQAAIHRRHFDSTD
jgi:hypothetical protein